MSDEKTGITSYDSMHMRSITDRVSAENEEIINNGFGKILHNINNNMLKEAERGFASYLVRLEVLVRVFRVIPDTLSKPFKRKLMKRIRDYYKSLGYTVSGNWDADADCLVIRW